MKGIARARELRREASGPERVLWGYLRTLRRTGHHFRRQAPFRGYVPDFVSYRDRLVIEVDGAAHGDAERAAHDAMRDGVLRREGFAVLRVLAADVLGNLEGVAWVVEQALLAPHPGPPHEGEGEERGGIW